MARRQEPITPEGIVEITTRYLSTKETLLNSRAALEQAQQKLDAHSEAARIAEAAYTELRERLKDGN